MALSAAEMQKRHELEGAPDPFPSLISASVKTEAQSSVSSDPLDTTSEIAFPSLISGSPSSGVKSNSVWGAAAGPRIKSTGQKAAIFTDTIHLDAIDLSNSGRDGKPTTLSSVMKQVMAKYKVKIDASANQKSRQTTFHLKAESQKELDKAKRSLLALLSPVITLVLDAPVSTIPSIIGQRGATLKHIRDQTSVRVDIPKRDSNSPVNGHAEGPTNGKAYDDDDEAMIPITLVGPQPLAYEAREMLNNIIASKASKSIQRVRDIPVHVFPFVLARKDTFASSSATLSFDTSAREIIVSGNRESLGEIVDTIKREISDVESSIRSLKTSIPRRQHRLFTGAYANIIMAESRCAVFVPGPDKGDEVTIWGQQLDLPAGLGAVIKQANSKHIHEFTLPGPPAFSKNLATYLNRSHFIKAVKNNYPGVDIFLPSPQANTSNMSVDLVGDKSEVDAIAEQLSELISNLNGATREATVDWLLHRAIVGKNAKKLKQLHDTHNVQTYFPDEHLELSEVILVCDPMSTAAISLEEKKKRLDDAEKELVKIARDIADVKTQKISVDKCWHEAILGTGRTTLNAIIGEDTTLSIKVGAEAGNQDAEDVIILRGISAEVDRAVKDILKIVEAAKKDQIVNNYSIEFDVDKEYVGRIVGAHGIGISKLRDQLGVKVDVSNEMDEKEKEGGKKKKLVQQKCRFKITGRKENVEEAKKRILVHVERFADETSEILKIPAQFHSSLIGQNGKYAIRMEERYGVKITFPRHSTDGEGKAREQLKPNEVLVKGGKKGVADAKAELLEALEYEKETNNVLKFTIPTRSLPRVVGKGGASINEIKDQTEAQIDIEKGAEDGGATSVVNLRGTKKAIAAAQAAILAISNLVGEEATASVTIDNKYHRTIIGPGGQALRQLIISCGGPSDTKLQAGLVRFPRYGEPSDEVRLQGEPKLVARLKAALENIVADLQDRIVMAVGIPLAQHRMIIGRGGQNLKDLEHKFNVEIQCPGSRSYDQVDDPANSEELVDSDPATIIKVSGSPAACQKAITHLKNISNPISDTVKTVTVPLKYHHAISQHGSFFRTLRDIGVQVEHSAKPGNPATPVRPTSARIDDESNEPAWEVVPNYQDADEGDSIWTLKARDEAALDKAESLIKEAIDQAASLTHVGFLTLPDRSMFSKIIGTKGANINRMRNETGAEINTSRENTTIVIIGSETRILAAKDAIFRVMGASSQRHE